MTKEAEAEGKRLAENMWSPQRVSEFLGVPIGTLTDWRYRGTGPRSYRVGRHVRYDPHDVRAFLLKSSQLSDAEDQESAAPSVTLTVTRRPRRRRDTRSA
jgi:hypothetical protein